MTRESYFATLTLPELDDLEKAAIHLLKEDEPGSTRQAIHEDYLQAIREEIVNRSPSPPPNQGDQHVSA